MGDWDGEGRGGGEGGTRPGRERLLRLGAVDGSAGSAEGMWDRPERVSAHWCEHLGVRIVVGPTRPNRLRLHGMQPSASKRAPPQITTARRAVRHRFHSLTGGAAECAPQPTVPQGSTCAVSPRMTLMRGQRCSMACGCDALSRFLALLVQLPDWSCSLQCALVSFMRMVTGTLTSVWGHRRSDAWQTCHARAVRQGQV
jgi:hypothetical protein